MTKEQKNTQVTHPERSYYYRPLRYYRGTVYKCAGFGAEDPKHRAFYEPFFNGPGCDPEQHKMGDVSYLPGVVILQGYRGDRIHMVDDEWVEYTPHRCVVEITMAAR